MGPKIPDHLVVLFRTYVDLTRHICVFSMKGRASCTFTSSCIGLISAQDSLLSIHFKRNSQPGQFVTAIITQFPRYSLYLLKNICLVMLMHKGMQS